MDISIPLGRGTISTKTWWRLGVGMVAVVLAILVFVYSGRISEHNSLLTGIAEADRNLPGILAERRTLESQVAQLSGRLDALNAQSGGLARLFPVAMDGTGYTQILFDLADEHGLQITTIAGTEPGAELQGPGLLSVRYDISIVGSLDNITSFLRTLARDSSFIGLTVTSMSIGAFGEPNSLLRISLIGYGYPGQ